MTTFLRGRSGRAALASLALVLPLLTTLAIGATPAGASVTVFTSSGTYSIPPGVTSLTVDAIGAPGSPVTHGGSPPGPAGDGAEVVATIPVPPGATTLFVGVGLGGGTSGFGGYGGGESDVRTCAPGSAGCGGLTAAPATDPRLVVAGGGGGGGEDPEFTTSGGGTGGTAGIGVTGTTAGNGGSGTNSAPGGNGGDVGWTQGGNGSAAVAGPGASTCGGSGSLGAPGAGGAGENASNANNGGGGGAGWVGGSGGGVGTPGGTCTYGSGAGGGGGAGLSFVESSATGVSVSPSAAGPQVTITADQGPAFTSASSTTFVLGQPGGFTVSTSGTPTPSLSESGTLPSGVSFTDNGNGTASLAGTPAAGSAGSYVLTLTAGNSVSTATQTFTLTVGQAPAITSGSGVTFTAGSGQSTTITASGSPTPSLSEAQSLPPGMSFHDNGNGTATLGGTPATGTGGTYALTVVASNVIAGTTYTASQAFTLTVDEAPAVTSAATTTFLVGSAGSFTVATRGYPFPSIAETGTLPAGVSLVDNHNGTATLSGTPSGTAKAYPITLTATIGSTVASQSFTLNLDQAPAFTTTSLPTFTVGTPVNTTISTTGFPLATLTETGALPSGIVFTNNGNGTGTLSGTPAAGSGGSYPFSVTAVNGLTPNATQSFTLSVDQTPGFTSAAGTTFTAGSAGTFTVTTSGFPNGSGITLSRTGSLPSGVGFVNNGNGTATISGTPAALSGGTWPITITASNVENGSTVTSSQPFTLTVDEAPSVTSSSSVTFVAGTSGSFTVATSGFPKPSLFESSALPSGLTFTDNGNGTATLAGTAASGTGGTYPVTITASNGVGSRATQTLTVTVDEAPSVTSDPAGTFVAGSDDTFTVTTSGFPAPSLTESGTLPSGVSFTDDHDGTATISGTPASGTGGTWPITIVASNVVGGASATSSQQFTLTVDEAPSFTSEPATTFVVGQSTSYPVTTSGFGNAVTMSESGPLPSGVSFVPGTDGTGSLEGTPDAGTGGVWVFTLVASNGVDPDATQTFTLTVDEAPAVTSAASATFETGSAGTFTVTTSGYPAAALSAVGTLPSGVTFTDNGDGTGTFAGTPASGSGGAYPVSIDVANDGGSGSQDFTLFVDQPPSVTSAGAATFVAGQSGTTFTVTTSGSTYPAATLSLAGTLPSGMTFTDNHDGTGTLGGTPAAGTVGTYVLTVVADNGVAPGAEQTFTLTVDQAPAITSAASTTFVVGQAGSFTVTSTGLPTGAYSDSGSLPAGVTLVDGHDGTALLSGTPQAGTGGTYQLQITVTNGIAPSATQTLTLVVDQAPAVTSGTGATFTDGRAGTFKVTTSGFPAPALSEAGSLPAGLTFRDNGNGTATLGGTPASVDHGTYVLTITAANDVGRDARQTFTVGVNQAPAVTSPSSVTLTVGSPARFTVTTSGFPSATVGEAGALPAGLSFTHGAGGTGTLSGTPASGSAGTWVLHLSASNAAGSATQLLTLHVDYAPGFVIAGARGELANFGRASTAGSLPGKVAASGVVAVAETPDARGAWLLGSKGAIFGVGADAHYRGAPPAAGGPYVAIASTPDGNGYWVLSASGGVYGFGDAHYYGSLPGSHVLTKSAVGIAPTTNGHGYDIATSNGAVYTYGNARYHGGANNLHLHSPIVAITLDEATGGYWLAGKDGGVFSYGARFVGASTGLTPIDVVGIATTPDSAGYWLVELDGALLPFGDAAGGVRQTGIGDTVGLSGATP